jgi:hypothetical protein
MLCIVGGPLPRQVLNVVEKLGGPTSVVAHHSRRDKCWKYGAVPALQKPLRDESFDGAIVQALEDVVGRAQPGWEHPGHIAANKVVEAKPHHRTERSVDDVDAKRRDVDNELTDRGALEYCPVQIRAFP